jgi:hypothetical protein
MGGSSRPVQGSAFLRFRQWGLGDRRAENLGLVLRRLYDDRSDSSPSARQCDCITVNQRPGHLGGIGRWAEDEACQFRSLPGMLDIPHGSDSLPLARGLELCAAGGTPPTVWPTRAPCRVASFSSSNSEDREWLFCVLLRRRFADLGMVLAPPDWTARSGFHAP